MDIQKLAAEMGLNCITAYRLDALKSVARVNGSADPVIPARDEDSLVVNVNDSGQLGFPVEGEVSATPKVFSDLTCREKHNRPPNSLLSIHFLLFSANK